MSTVFKPRPMQKAVMEYVGGKMGVSAVPGSGKTQTLSALAARLVLDGSLQDHQEVLIVTLVNSAVENFTTRMTGMLSKYGLLPGMGYRVRTLHGLAHDIVKERPDLAGLSDKFTIVDEREAYSILESTTLDWLKTHTQIIHDHSKPELDAFKNPKLFRSWQNLLIDIAGSFIKTAKDLQAAPSVVQEMVNDHFSEHPFLTMGSEIYTDYQHALNYRNAVDFDDLIRLALQAIQTDQEYLHRLRSKWPYILEDEAQDSSRTQENILRLLAGESGNWVRVGDPNQAIYETFTTASPDFLRNFLKEPGVVSRSLPNSGRSTHSIMWLANSLVEWSMKDHPNPLLGGALTLPYIEPTPPGDPQPNPQDQPEAIHLIMRKYSPEQEVAVVAQSVQKWLEMNGDQTLVILVPRNERGARMVEELQKIGIEPIELLRSSQSTRRTTGLLATILRALAEPSNSRWLQNLYYSLGDWGTFEGDSKVTRDQVSVYLKRCSNLEDYLWPRPERDWLKKLENEGIPEICIIHLLQLRTMIRKWQPAALLPPDQVLLTVSRDLFTNPGDIALAHKLALSLERSTRTNPEWGLVDFAIELEGIANNRRKYSTFNEEDTGFNPDDYPGKVVVATIHKAKGLEWDKVYMLSANQYDFPSALPGDQFISEKWCVQDRLNLQAETLATLKAGLSRDLLSPYQEMGNATREARIDYVKERLRLFYVGITRARKELVITWNTGKSAGGEPNSQPAQALIALSHLWEKSNHAAAN